MMEFEASEDEIEEVTYTAETFKKEKSMKKHRKSTTPLSSANTSVGRKSG